MKLNRSGWAFRTYWLLHPELPHHSCREMILHGVVEEKWTLRHPKKLVVEAKGVESMTFLEHHDLQQLIRHPSSLKRI
jgi:hypothetical protein